MTDLSFEPESPDIDPVDVPLDPWMLSTAREATDVEDAAIPREMMWARVQQTRRRAPSPASSGRSSVPPWAVRVAGIAALLVGGIGIGRYLMPATGPSKYQLALTQSAARADSITALGLGPDALAALPPADDPAHVAMEEHLVSTVALLTTVRDEDPSRTPAADVSGRARDLLGTTRLLLDEPQLRDERTRRLLQDLELVLVQIVQARTSAPETKRAPSETMRETNLLPRVRAAATASRRGDDLTLGGGGL
jgi:hypothetical protein